MQYKLRYKYQCDGRLDRRECGEGEWTGGQNELNILIGRKGINHSPSFDLILKKRETYCIQFPQKAILHIFCNVLADSIGE